MLDLLRTIVAFCVVLGVLVFAHEMGHYLAARWRGVHVDIFSIGFGRAIVQWRDRVGTTWKISWLPLGGFVKLHGQESPADATEEARAGWMSGRTFHDKGVGSRALVVAAGPVANFALAFLLFSVLFATFGLSTVLPVISSVLPGSAADHAGLMAGDRITSINGRGTTDFEALQRIVASQPGQTVAVAVTRGDQQLTRDVTLDGQDRPTGRVGVLGVRGTPSLPTRLPPLQAMAAGADQTWSVTTQTLAGLWQMITRQRGADDLGGPLRIAQLSGRIAANGAGDLFYFVAVLSVNLGLINLFPVPVLDGGHLLFYLIEGIRGRPLTQRAQEYGLRAGFAVLGALFLFATWNDLSHLGVRRWFSALGVH